MTSCNKVTVVFSAESRVVGVIFCLRDSCVACLRDVAALVVATATKGFFRVRDRLRRPRRMGTGGSGNWRPRSDDGVGGVSGISSQASSCILLAVVRGW